MQILSIVIVVILCLVAVQVVVVVVYIAAKRYYYDYVRTKMRLQRLEKLAMYIPAAATARIDRLKETYRKRPSSGGGGETPTSSSRKDSEQQRPTSGRSRSLRWSAVKSRPAP